MRRGRGRSWVGIAWLVVLALGLLMGRVAVAALPSGWNSQEIGTPGQAGSAAESSGVWTVTGSGADIWTTSDNCHYAYRSIHGDFDISCRLADVTGGNNAWRKAGLMARPGMDNAIRMVMTTIAPFQNPRGRHFYHRNSDGAAITSEEHQIQTGLPVYIRLVRSGQTFSSYGSENGTDWVQIGSSYTYTGGDVMPDTMYVGMAVTSHDNGQTATGTFDDLKGLPILNDVGAGAITMSSASLNAELVETNGPTYVWAYWGTEDGGTNTSGAGAWSNVEDFWLPQAVGPLSTNLTGLVPDTLYYYRYYASNVNWAAWAPQSSRFNTASAFSWDGDTDDMWGTAANWIGNNVPNAPGEYAQFIGVGAGDVNLNGSSYTVDFVEFKAGDYVLTNTGASATLTAGGLTNWAGDNTLAARVSVNGTVEVADGRLTLKDVGNFSAAEVALSGGALQVWGSWTVGAAVGALSHFGYNYNDDNDLYLNNNGGIMAVTPDGIAALTDGPGGRGLDFNNDADFTGTGAVSVNDNYMNLFIGFFNAKENGDHEFRINQDDDRSGMWFDLNQNGVFESSQAGLGSDRGEQLAWENGGVKTVALTAGERYMFAVTHREGGGGSGIHAMVKTPSMTVETTIKPSDPEQAGLWSADGYGDIDALATTPIIVKGDSALELMSDAATVLGDMELVNGTVIVSAKPTGSVSINSTTGDGGLDCTLKSTAIETPSSLGTLLMSAGGMLRGAEISASTAFVFEPTLIVSNVLTGSAYLHVGDADAVEGQVVLTATNSYTDRTQIERGALRADEGVGLPVVSRIVFSQNNRDQAAVLETSGTLARNIGTAANEVFWENIGGFSAGGGDLTVTLEGGAELPWGDGNNGFNNRDSVQFGSLTADGKVELTNPIHMQTGTRRFQIQNNPATKSDFVRLSGVISGNNGGQELRFNESSANNFFDVLVEMTATNNYTQRTRIDDATVYALEGVGLPVNSLLRFDGNNDWRPAVLMSVGTMNRNCGQGDGEVDWQSRGGFAARGGTFTVTLEGGAQLNWGDRDTGFNNQRVHMNSEYADSVVELTNPIDLNAVERWLHVFDNTDSTNDHAVISGVITGSNPGEEFWKASAGTLVLTGSNTFTQRMTIDAGILRAKDGVGLPTVAQLIFDEANAALPCIFESSGRFERNIGAVGEAGTVSWDWQHGGFAAFGGPLDILLEGGAALTSQGDNHAGFDGHWLHLGSRTADDVVTLENDLLLVNDGFQMRLFDNPDRTDDYGVLAGNITYSGWGDMEVRGEGLLRMTGNNIIRQFRVYDSARVLINGAHRGTDYVYTEDRQNGVIGGSGSLTVSHYFDIREGGTLAPGDGVGTLSVTVARDDLDLWAGATYEWELGDKVTVTGSLRLNAGWTLKVMSLGGMPVATEEYDLFTYTGTMYDYNAPTIDTSAVPADWVTDGVQVVHDDVGKRVYITGLSSTLGIVNREPTDVTTTSAQLNGVVSCSGQVLHVWAYWGGTDGGTDSGAWGDGAYVGAYSNVMNADVSQVVAGLTTNAMNYYTFRATNALSDLWAQPSVVFSLQGPPSVDNAGGATRVMAGSATLNGRFLDHNRGQVAIFWGSSDGGTNDPLAWDHMEILGSQTDAAFAVTVTDVLYPQTYYYRCAATNAHGFDWSDSAEVFTVLQGTSSRYPLAGLMGRWSFDDDTCDDTSGNGYHGENVGGIYSTDVPGPLAGGKSMDLSAGDYWVQVDTGGSQDVFDLDALTVACWVKGWPNGGWEPFVSKRGENGQGWQLRRHAGDADGLSWTLRGPGNDDWFVNSNVLTDGGWHHIASTYGESRRRIYIDGILTGEELRYGPINDNTDMLVFGARQNGGTFQNQSRVRLDDILIYNRPLTPAEIAQLSANAPIRSVTVANALATDVTLNSANLNADVALGNSVYDVWVYWGQTNEGTNSAGAWDELAFVGTYTDYVGSVSYPITGLTAGVATWYTFRLINANDSLWATPSASLVPVAAPVVDNAPGALVDVGAATLRGTLTAGNFATVIVYWGRSDGGTISGSWDSAVVLNDTAQGTFSAGVSAGHGVTYHYRCYATNAAGHAWAASTASFEMPLPPIEGLTYTNGLRGSIFQGMLQDETPVNLDGASFSNSMTRVFGGDKAGTVLALNENAAYNVVAMGEILNWGRFPGFVPGDSFVTAFSGRIFPRSTGIHGFRWSNDDRGLMFIDRNGDGTFATEERVAGYAWDGTGFVTLTNGVGGYDFMFMAQEFGGGQTLNWWVVEPAVAPVEARVDTVAQAPLWQYQVGTETLLALANETVADVTTNSAVMAATLKAPGWTFDVYAHWGTSDGGTVVGDWEFSSLVGAFVNQDGTVSVSVDGLGDGTDYFYTFRATNDATNVWAVPSIAFQTMSPPTVANLAASDVTMTSATLNGDLIHGGMADVTVYWGMSDGGENQGLWAHTNALAGTLAAPFSLSVPVAAGGRYYYRCYASNALGAAWADSTETFLSTSADITIADASIVEGDVGQRNMTFAVTLSAPAASNVVVAFATSVGSATAGSDYVSTNGVLSIPAGMAAGQIAVPVYGDFLGEYPSETLMVNLSGAVNAVLGDGTAVGTIVDDDYGASLAAWRVKMKITFSGYVGSETLTNFPALVALDTSIPEFDYSQFASPAGLDLRFSDALKEQELNYEIEHWDPNGTSYVWVQVPALVGTDTAIWAFWGNKDQVSSAPAYTMNGATWSQGFEAVWHMSEPNAQDSSANQHNGTANLNVDAAGIVGVAQGFADNGLIEVNTGINLRGKPFTFRAWSKRAAAGDDFLCGLGPNGTDTHLHIGFRANGQFALAFYADDLNINGPWDDTTAWHHWACRYDETTRLQQVYRDAVWIGERTANGQFDGSGSFYIGARAPGNYNFSGQIDEVRLNNGVLSTDWIAAEYGNIADHANFNTYSDVEAPRGTLLIVR